MKQSFWNTRRLTIFGLMSALVFVSSWMQIPVGDVSRIHLGNGFCALTGLLFGPWLGGLASGMGSMLFDFTNPLYIAESWITFLTKFAIGFLAGWLAQRGQGGTPARQRIWDVAGAASGTLAYVVLYLTKSFVIKYWIEGQALEAVQVQLATKLVSSLINAAVGTIVAVLLAQALRPALRRAGLFGKATGAGVSKTQET